MQSFFSILVLEIGVLHCDNLSRASEQRKYTFRLEVEKIISCELGTNSNKLLVSDFTKVTAFIFNKFHNKSCLKRSKLLKTVCSSYIETSRRLSILRV